MITVKGGGSMDANKTGALIAETRRARNMTQKALAEALHISDRTVSKWERGAGFPDVALLEPLSDALGLTLPELLHGERAAESAPDADLSAREALRTLSQLTKRKLRRTWRSILGVALLLACIGWFAVHMIHWDTPVDQTIPAQIYENGIVTDETEITFRGELTQYLLGERFFTGSVEIPLLEKTCSEHTQAQIHWNEDGLAHLSYRYYADFKDLGVRSVRFTKDLQGFAIGLADGRILATDYFYFVLVDEGIVSVQF